ncbi:hypothetical protein [Marinobacterium jannaschii]|uniref:hypothetical protein n=1 Tax=Marinobacterium jannaschii TaxID=64970 RepID=UPI0004879913|nr:hypothetical protein [Marinobacterium jannaschii]
MASKSGLKGLLTDPQKKSYRRILGLGAVTIAGSIWAFTPDSVAIEAGETLRVGQESETGALGKTTDADTQKQASEHASQLYEKAVGSGSTFTPYRPMDTTPDPDISQVDKAASQAENNESQVSQPPADNESSEPDSGDTGAPEYPEKTNTAVATLAAAEEPMSLDSMMNRLNTATGLEAPDSVDALQPQSPLEAYAQVALKRLQQQPDSVRLTFSGAITARATDPAPSATQPNLVAGNAQQALFAQPNTPEADAESLDSNPNQAEAGFKDPVTFTAGHYMYGLSLSAINSDVANRTVLAEVVGGPFGRARLMGTWDVLSEWTEELSLVFTTMTWNGQTQAVNLVAFNAETDLPAFASDVDRHLLTRYGGLFLGSVGEALKERVAARQQNETDRQFDGDGNLISESIESLTNDELDSILIESVGAEFFSNLKNHYNRPITRSLRKHQDLKLLAMTTITLDRGEKGK